MKTFKLGDIVVSLKEKIQIISNYPQTKTRLLPIGSIIKVTAEAPGSNFGSYYLTIFTTYPEYDFRLATPKEIKWYSNNGIGALPDKLEEKLYFEKGDYIVVTNDYLNPLGSNLTKNNYCFKHGSQVYTNLIPERTWNALSNSYSCSIKLSDRNKSWRWATEEEIAEYNRLGKPYDVTTLKMTEHGFFKDCKSRYTRGDEILSFNSGNWVKYEQDDSFLYVLRDNLGYLMPYNGSWKAIIYQNGQFAESRKASKEETLLEKANRSYPRGTKYRHAGPTKHICNIKGDHSFYQDEDYITDGYGGSVYYKGNWADIITTRELRSDLVYEQHDNKVVSEEKIPPIYHVGNNWGKNEEGVRKDNLLAEAKARFHVGSAVGHYLITERDSIAWYGDSIILSDNNYKILANLYNNTTKIWARRNEDKTYPEMSSVNKVIIYANPVNLPEIQKPVLINNKNKSKLIKF